MGRDKIRYFLFLEGRWRWRPTRVMRDAGFRMVPMGKGGPGTDAEGNPAPSAEDIRRALALNAEWDAVRCGTAPRQTIDRPPVIEGSVAACYHRAMALRDAERAARGIIWTKEQRSRDDWPRAWKWIGPAFGDCDPRTIQPEHFIEPDGRGGATGLLIEVEQRVSVSERHRVVKVWRALWGKMAAMGYCERDADPTLMFRNSAPDPRQVAWHRAEILRLVRCAWRMGYHGLAACIATAWDSMCSPVDVRTLKPSQVRSDAGGIWFAIERAKTGKAAAATLSPWSEAILTAYVKRLGVDIAPQAPIFRNRSGAPYSKDTLGDDFRAVRAALDPLDTRQLADMRRSGAIEGDAGGGSVTEAAAKMANTVAANNRLRKTYNPVNLASVRQFDRARMVGAQRLEQKPDESVRKPDILTLFEKAAKNRD